MDTELKKRLDVKLALAVERFPLLWDCSSDMYKRADLKPEAWSKVVSEIGAPATETWAMKRWKAVKDTFHDNYRKVRESKKSGVGTDDVFKPTSHLYPYLKYLIKTCAQASSSSNLDSIVLEAVSSPSSQVSEASEVANSLYYDSTLEKWCLVPPDNVVNDSHQASQSADLNISSSTVQSDGSISMLISPGPSTPDEDMISPQAQPVFAIPCRPASAPPPGKRAADDNDTFFNSRGSAKKSSNFLLQTAVKAMEKIASEPPITSLPVVSAPGNESLKDECARFIAGRLEHMDPSTRKICENELLQVIMKY